MEARKQYCPRAFAGLAMRHLAQHPRCALWAKPGVGKSVLTLTHLDYLHNVWGEDRPTLVLGPLRVAQSVWSDEVRKWQHLRGLDVVPIVGKPAEREAALRADAPVKTINYENLPWLLAQDTWPFATVVADESTKLKSFRLRQGGKRAQALAQVAHKNVRRWINLTGTPSPNGLGDLWGQTWFLDAGERLGRTFSAFEDRYFGFQRRSGSQFSKPVLLPHSAELIHEKLADICMTLDPKDWFDLAEPVVTQMYVDLPKAQRAQYRALERDMFVQLESGAAVEAVSAAALTIKCLQMANGAAYVEGGGWQETHTEKLDALADLADEVGEPILVAYHFKSDLARLKARFPDGLDLATTAGMAGAKSGRGRLWFGHPAGMGHGVDGLQEHCSTIAVFGHWWDLEQYDQFVERVGPMRQMQAGKNKPVFIHHIVARGTVDEVVSARRATKRATQDLLMEYMKERG